MNPGAFVIPPGPRRLLMVMWRPQSILRIGELISLIQNLRLACLLDFEYCIFFPLSRLS
jgi:hypothetical protein